MCIDGSYDFVIKGQPAAAVLAQGTQATQGMQEAAARTVPAVEMRAEDTRPPMATSSLTT